MDREFQAKRATHRQVSRLTGATVLQDLQAANAEHAKPARDAHDDSAEELASVKEALMQLLVRRPAYIKLMDFHPFLLPCH